MQKAIIGFLLFIIVFMFFSGIFFFYEARFMSGRASVVKNSFDPETSYVTSTPPSVKGDGIQKIRVYVNILSGQGLGVLGKVVTLSNPEAQLTINMAGANTNALGMAYFDISSKVTGEFYLDAKVDGIALPQKAHLLFN